MKQLKKKRKSYCIRIEDGLPELARYHGINISQVIEEALDKKIKKAQDEETPQ